MNDYNIKKIKKKILYRSSYTGTKEADLLYQKFIVNKIDQLNNKELLLLSELFNEISDEEILLIFTKKKFPNKKFKDLFIKLMK